MGYCNPRSQAAALVRFAPVLLLVVGCSSGTANPHSSEDSSQGHNHSAEVSFEEANDYLRDHFPSREQMSAARKCATAKTGYEYPALPDDYGPQFVTDPDPSYIASVAEREVPPEVSEAFVACVFELGLEEHYFLPQDHQKLKGSLDQKQ